jgi:Galactose oxidase, central domain
MIARLRLPFALLALVLAVALGASCLGDTGTVSVGLLTAPQSTLLEGAERVRLTLTNPRTTVEARRQNGTFALALEAPAAGDLAAVQVEVFDAADKLIGVGATPQFSAGPINARVAVYVAAPDSMGAAPTTLAVGRFEVGSARLPYGVIIAGGRDNSNAVRGEVEIYNAYDHTLRRGLDLPQARAGVAMGATVDGQAYIFGGLGADNTPHSDAWRFDTRVSPAGFIAEFPSGAPARAGERAVQISSSRFLVTGATAIIDALDGSVLPTDVAEVMPREAAAVIAADRVVVIGAGARVVRFRDDAFDVLSVPTALRTGHAVVSTADAQIAVIGGELASQLTRDVVKIDPVSGTGVVIPGVLEVGRRRAAVARAGNRIVVAGGSSADGEILGTAEILDGTTLAHLATVPMAVRRTAASAEALGNGQILVIGGIDGQGRPTELLELYTPGLPQ